MRISVIVPALNEEAAVEECLRTIEAAGTAETIVVDGGSSDETCTIAQRYALVMRASRGRAVQMNSGARRATGDVLAARAAWRLARTSCKQRVANCNRRDTVTLAKRQPARQPGRSQAASFSVNLGGTVERYLFIAATTSFQSFRKDLLFSAITSGRRDLLSRATSAGRFR